MVVMSRMRYCQVSHSNTEPNEALERDAADAAPLSLAVRSHHELPPKRKESCSMFRVVVWKSIWTHEESVVRDSTSERALVLGRPEGSPEPKVALLKRELSLPFAPFPGLSLSSQGWSCCPLQTAAWSDEEQMFRCTVQDEYPRWALDTPLSFEDLLSMSLDEGWERPVLGGGNAPRNGKEG
jgi:hypothetical protein